MGTVNFSIPDDVKNAFNAAFDGRNKSAIVTALMRQAIAREGAAKRSRAAVKRIIAALTDAPAITSEAARAARENGRP